MQTRGSQDVLHSRGPGGMAGAYVGIGQEVPRCSTWGRGPDGIPEVGTDSGWGGPRVLWAVGVLASRVELKPVWAWGVPRCFAPILCWQDSWSWSGHHPGYPCCAALGPPWWDSWSLGELRWEGRLGGLPGATKRGNWGSLRCRAG